MLHMVSSLRWQAAIEYVSCMKLGEEELSRKVNHKLKRRFANPQKCNQTKVA